MDGLVHSLHGKNCIIGLGKLYSIAGLYGPGDEWPLGIGRHVMFYMGWV
jgi:hypothetical protein